MIKAVGSGLAAAAFVSAAAMQSVPDSGMLAKIRAEGLERSQVKPVFDALRRVKGWVPVDGTYDLGKGPRETPQQQEVSS